jgi:CRISPR-associated protein Cmr6
MMRRKSLLTTEHHPSTHAGLWLDKFLRQPADREKVAVEKSKLLREASATAVPEGYKKALEQRHDSFMALADRDRALVFKASVLGRLVVGLGQKGVLEAGLRLEATWGVPILPGSSLKGLAAATAHRLVEDAAWHRGQASFETLFGTTDEGGAVVFHDAWWIPGDAKTLPIHPDVMTVHHQDYYAGKSVAPSDLDSPVPVPFATVNGDYLVVLEGSPEWCRAAEELLAHGLAELGAGAKTNAGYGRMTLEALRSKAQQDRHDQMAAAEQRVAERKATEAARLKSAIDNLSLPLPSPANLPSRAADRVKWLMDAESVGVDEGLLRDHGMALYAVDPKWWRNTWRTKEGKRTDAERAIYDRYMKPSGA